MKSYYRGGMLGTGLGDAIGRSREGGGMVKIDRIRDLVRGRDLLRYTDDTQQMMALADSLSEKGGFDGQNLAEKLVEYFDPSRGYGPGSSKVIRKLGGGVRWDEPAKELFGGAGSYGNGSSMRIAPVGLFACGDLEELKKLARKSSSITHVHSLGRDGAVLQATSVGIVAREDPSSELDTSTFLDELDNAVSEEKYEEKVSKVRELLEANPDKSEVVRSLGHGVEAFNSVPTAVYCFLSHPESFEGAVLYAVSLGGDADTIGAMTGAIAGAYHGADRISEEWKDKLEHGDKIVDLADRLIEALPDFSKP